METVGSDDGDIVDDTDDGLFYQMVYESPVELNQR